MQYQRVPLVCGIHLCVCVCVCVTLCAYKCIQMMHSQYLLLTDFATSSILKLEKQVNIIQVPICTQALAVAVSPACRHSNTDIIYIYTRLIV